MIAIYVRESTPRQYEKGFNFETQKEKALQYISLYDMEEEYEFYLEKGYSAKTTKRPAMNKLKKDIVSGKITTLIVYKLDRLLRRHKGKEEIFGMIEDYNIKFMSVEEKIDTTTAYGKFILNQMVSFTELEQDINSERTNAGLQMGADLGFYMIGGTKPFGWQRYEIDKHKKIRVDEEEKRIIHKMADLLKAGYSMFQIKTIINDDEYMKSISKTLCENQITNILKSELNVGIINYKGKIYHVEGETIFTKGEYTQVQNDLSERSKEGKYNYLFYHKIRNTNGEMAKVKCTIKKDRVYLYHFDINSKKRINENDIKEDVLAYIKNHDIIYKQKRTRTYTADIKQLNKKRKQLKTLYEDMDLTTEIYLKEMAELDKEQKQIEVYHNRYITNFESWFNKQSFEQQSKIIWQHIKYIEVDFDTKKIEVHS